MSALLELEDVSLSLGGRTVLSDVSLSLHEGEALVLAGPSGSGKTSLLRLALGLLAPSLGSIRIGGKQASAPGRILLLPNERGAGAVFQDLALWPHLTVIGNLDFGLAATGLPKAERAHAIDTMLAQVGLAGLGHRRPHELSGGQQQRVALARALVVEPRWIALDEPFTNLDIVLKADILELLASLLLARNTAVLLVAHDPDEAAQFADRMAVLEEGKLVQIGTREMLAESPRSAFVRAFTRTSRGRRGLSSGGP
ncbi:ATP-binding cassette domain-containing protein [Pendulispora rubella]|uniref:ATP-binding cassette domain-containing protein n=1 Tax=Pendulispora rubella TaxID=2741070 RepID=A0ABZ2L757_9BACT